MISENFSSLSNYAKTFDFEPFQKKHPAVISFLFGLAVYKSVEGYLKHNLRIVYNRHKSTPIIGQLVSVATAVGAVAHYALFQAQYLDYARGLQIATLNSLKVFGSFAIAGGLAAKLVDLTIPFFARYRVIHDETARRIKYGVGIAAGLLAMGITIKRFPLTALSAVQNRWLAITCLGAAAILFPYKEDSRQYKAKYALMGLTGGALALSGVMALLKR